MAKAPIKAAVKPAAAKAVAKKPAAKGAEPELLDGIFVRSLPATFRRAGFTFTREGSGLLLADLSPQQLDAIEAEPLLSVTHAQFPDTAKADAMLAALIKANAEADAEAEASGADAGDAKEGANATPGDGNAESEKQEGNA